jgi:hypothetical protein
MGSINLDGRWDSNSKAERTQRTAPICRSEKSVRQSNGLLKFSVEDPPTTF